MHGHVTSARTCTCAHIHVEMHCNDRALAIKTCIVITHTQTLIGVCHDRTPMHTTLGTLTTCASHAASLVTITNHNRSPGYATPSMPLIKPNPRTYVIVLSAFNSPQMHCRLKQPTISFAQSDKTVCHMRPPATLGSREGFRGTPTHSACSYVY